MRCLAISPLAIVALLAAIGCGPSLRRMHRSDVYFERCYAADLDRRVPVEERRACWQAWMTHWQTDQPPERIDYVRERLLRLDPERAALLALATGGADGDPVPLTETSPAIAAEAQRVSDAASTSPEEAASETTPPPAEPLAEVTNPTPPPSAVPVRTEPRVEPGDGREATPVGHPEAPPATIAPARERRATRTPVMPVVEPPHCAASCRPGWTECTARCVEHERMACLRACRLELRTCARACY